MPRTWLALLETIFADDKGKRDSFSVNYFFDPPPEDKPERNRLSKKQPLKFTADSVTNSILVQNADDDQLAEIKSLVDFYDRNEPPDSQSIRKTKIVVLEARQSAGGGRRVKGCLRRFA